MKELEFSKEQIHFCYFGVLRLKKQKKKNKKQTKKTTEACLNQITSKSIGINNVVS